MGSFTDIVPQFNPYVPKFPLELIGQAGMYKQQKYEENVQKIQGEIDKIAGLDILRDVDKAHLQSRLNELGNNLTYMSAGDFSNFQLVNSVSGMTKQLVQDKNIQTAVSSTAWYRKQVAEMEKAMSEGKSSQSNIWDFNEKAGKYMNSKDLGRSFSDRYTPYTDVRKKVMETIKTIHPNLESVDIPNVIRPDGSIDYGAIGAAMVRNKVERVTEDQIKQAIYANLTPDDINQLSIDGRYQFRGVTPQQLGNRARASYEESFADASKNLSLLDATKRTNTDPKTDKFLKDQIAYYKGLIGDDKNPGSLYQTYEANVQNIAKNPDAVKAEIYKDGFIKEFANAFKWQSVEKQLLSNPIRQQMNWAAELAQKQYEFVENKKIAIANLRVSQTAEQRLQDQFKYQKQKDALEAAQKQADKVAEERAKKYGMSLGMAAIPLGKSTMDEDNAEEVFAKYQKDVSDEMKSAQEELRKLNFNDADIDAMLIQLAAGKSKSIDERALPYIVEMARKKDYLTQLFSADEDIRKKATASHGMVDGKSYKEWEKIYEDKKKLLENDELFNEAFPTWSDRMEYFGKLKEIEQKVQTGTDNYYKEYSKQLSNRFGKIFTPTLRSVGVSEKGGMTDAALDGLLLINQRQKDIDGVTIPDEFFTEKNKKDTKTYVKQDGTTYSIIVKNSALGEEKEIPATPGDVSDYLGSEYLNNNQEISMRIEMSKDRSSSLTKDPNDATFKSAYNSFPNMQTIDLNANLLYDKRTNAFVVETYPFLKDGSRGKVRLTGKNRNGRLGYDQSVEMFNNLTDQEYLNLIMQQYPTFDVFSIEGVNKK